MSAENFEKITSGIFHIIASFGFLVAGIWGLVEYYDNKRVNRIKETRQYISTISAGDIKTSEQFLVKYWTDFDWKSHQGDNKKALIIKIVSENPEYELHLKKVLIFLENITHCTSQDICDLAMVKKHFRPLFLNGFVNHYSWIRFHRNKTGHESYYNNLECFVRNNFGPLQGDIEC